MLTQLHGMQSAVHGNTLARTHNKWCYMVLQLNRKAANLAKVAHSLNTHILHTHNLPFKLATGCMLLQHTHFVCRCHTSRSPWLRAGYQSIYKAVIARQPQQSLLQSQGRSAPVGIKLTEIDSTRTSHADPTPHALGQIHIANAKCTALQSGRC